MPSRTPSADFHPLPWIILILGAALAAAPAASLSAAENDVARVLTDRALVHHGAEGYATSELAAGSLVAILQTKGDWVAIKPPPGSFSWVAGSQVDVPSDEGGLARVSGEEVKAYVGTIFEQERLGWQVKLKHGEAVEIRGKKVVRGRDGKAETWYKISPPRSEVRWMLLEDLDRGEATELAAAPPAAEAPAEAERFNPVKAAAFNEALPAEAARPGQLRTAIPLEPIRGQAGPAALPSNPGRNDSISATPPPSGGWRVARSRPLSDFRGDSQPGATSASRASSPYSAPPAAFTTQPGGSEFADRLEWLELELARIATKEPREWNFTLVRQEGTKLLDAGTTAIERGRARLLMEKIDQFDEVRGRYEKLAAQQATGGANAATPAASPAPAPGLLAGIPSLLPGAIGTGVADPAVVGAPGATADYAGRGYLMPIVSARKNVPRFALTDDRGEVLQFVTPSPGVNLNQYLRKSVGINGRTGFLSDLGKPHITAERVIDLDRR